VAVHITILGSGSSGNCTYVETEHARLLIDAGLSGRQIRNRLLSIGRTVENLTGILLTHEHSDHCQGLTALAGKINVPVYANRLTREAIDLNLDVKPDFRLFSTGSSFDAGDVIVDTFSVPHDAYDPVGFMLRTPSGNIGFLTDLGHATKLSRHGHLSNDAAATAAQEIVSSDLEHVFLGHLSSDCNRPELARYAVAEALDKIGARNVGITVSMQDSPTATYLLNRPPLLAPQPGYELRSNPEPIFDQGDLFMEQTAPALRPIPVVPRTTPPRPGLSQ